MMRPMGPDRIRQRMAEIQARLDQITPRQPENFARFLSSAQGALNGPIGSGDGFAPLRPGSIGTAIIPAQGELQSMIHSAAQAQGLDPALLDALVSAESGYDPSAQSPKGAMGLTQLMPGTASALGVANPFDPQQNLMGGAKYLAGLIKRFGGDTRLALAAYNAGPNRVRDATRAWPEETVNYVNRVMTRFERQRSG